MGVHVGLGAGGAPKEVSKGCVLSDLKGFLHNKLQLQRNAAKWRNAKI